MSGSTVGVCPSTQPYYCPGAAPLGSALTIGGICYNTAASCAVGPNSCGARGVPCVFSSSCPGSFPFTCRMPSASKNREYWVTATLAISTPASVIEANLQGVRESVSQWLGVTPPVVGLSNIQDVSGAAQVDIRIGTAFADAAAAIQAAIRGVATNPGPLRANLSWARAFPPAVPLSLAGPVVVTPPPVPPPPSTWRELVDYVDQGFSNEVTVVADLVVTGQPLIIGPGKTLRIVGSCGSGRCRIDGQRRGNIMVVSTAGSLALENIALVNGLCDDATCPSFASSGGGALWAGGESSLTLRNCALLNNSAVASGGAIFSLGAVSLVDSTFASNYAGVGGGAIFVGGALAANSTQFSGNNAVQRGGAVEAGRGNATFFNATFTSNRALLGEGGAVFAAGPVLADSVTVLNNLAAVDGALGLQSGAANCKRFAANRSRIHVQINLSCPAKICSLILCCLE